MLRWLVFISAFLATFLDVALLYSINSMFVDIMNTFNATRADTSLIQSMALGVGPASGFMSGLLIPKIGLSKCGILFTTLASVGLVTCFLATRVWHLAVSFGIVFGPCAANILLCSSVATSQHFHGRRRFLALSILTTGVAFGGMAYPYILAYLSLHYGFRGALLIIGGLTMNSIPGCYFWTLSTTTSRQEEGTTQQVNRARIMQYQKDLKCKVTSKKEDVIITKHDAGPNVKDNDYIRTFPILNHQDNTICVSIEQCKNLDNENQAGKPHSYFKDLKTISRKPYFVIFWIGRVLTTPLMNMTMFFIADIFLDKDLSKGDTNFGLLLLNILNIIGRMLLGLLMQSERISVLFSPFIATFVLLWTMTGLILAKSRSFALLFCAMLGIPVGMFQAMSSVVSTSLVGVNYLTTAMSVILTTNGILNAIAGPVCGYIRDEVGSYDVVFYVAIATIGLVAVMFMVAMVQHRRAASRTIRRSTVFYLTSM